MAWIDLIEETVLWYGRLFSELYYDVVKPKFHHLYHVCDGMRAAGKLLSCWVTERRHRSTKNFGNHIFRHFETTLTIDAFNRMVVLAEEGAYFKREAIHSPKESEHAGVPISLGISAQLICGEVTKGDVVMLDDRKVGFVENFGNTDGGEIHCIVRLHMPLQMGANRYALASSGVVVVPASDILGLCMWASGDESLVVLPPPISATWV